MTRITIHTFPVPANFEISDYCVVKDVKPDAKDNAIVTVAHGRACTCENPFQ